VWAIRHVPKYRNAGILQNLDLDAHAVGRLRAGDDLHLQMVPFLSQGGHVIINLEDLIFVDGSGFGVLLACLRQVQSNGGELRLCGLHTPVRILFECVRMNRLFTICETRDNH
jgi:anti-sigma B factor antagonist